MHEDPNPFNVDLPKVHKCYFEILGLFKKHELQLKEGLMISGRLLLYTSALYDLPVEKLKEMMNDMLDNTYAEYLESIKQKRKSQIEKGNHERS